MERCEKCNAYSPTGLCFHCWRVEYAARRAARVVELEAALAAGKKVLHNGRVWPEIAEVVFVPEVRTPAYLAKHIENREHGFGMETRILGEAEESPEVLAAFAATAESIAMARRVAA